MVEADYAVVLF